MNIAVLGSGSWGTALANVLGNNGHDVRIWGTSAEIITEINNERTNRRYLPDDVILAKNIVGFTNMQETLRDVSIIVLAIPTKAIREVMTSVVASIVKPVLVVHVSKGIEVNSLNLISKMIAEQIPQKLLKNIVVLSGPSHAEEVSKKMITTICATATNIDDALLVQKLFSNNYFRVYTNDDIIGVQIAGALKNIIAIGVGISDGLECGDNARAAFMTRGLAEITRLGIAMGAKPYTFLGLTGLGDLIVTCTSVHSRNWRCGYQIGQGENLASILDNMGMSVEGVNTTKAAYRLARKFNVEMPIVDMMYGILFEDLDVKEAIFLLMNRGQKHEFETMFSS